MGTMEAKADFLQAAVDTDLVEILTQGILGSERTPKERAAGLEKMLRQAWYSGYDYMRCSTMTTHEVGITITRWNNGEDDRFRAYCSCKYLGDPWYMPLTAATQAIEHREIATQGHRNSRQKIDDAKQLVNEFFAAEEDLAQ